MKLIIKNYCIRSRISPINLFYTEKNFLLMRQPPWFTVDYSLSFNSWTRSTFWEPLVVILTSWISTVLTDSIEIATADTDNYLCSAEVEIFRILRQICIRKILYWDCFFICSWTTDLLSRAVVWHISWRNNVLQYFWKFSNALVLSIFIVSYILIKLVLLFV